MIGFELRLNFEQIQNIRNKFDVEYVTIFTLKEGIEKKFPNILNLEVLSYRDVITDELVIVIKHDSNLIDLKRMIG